MDVDNLILHFGENKNDSTYTDHFVKADEVSSV